MNETHNLIPCEIELPEGLFELKAFIRSVRPGDRRSDYPTAVDLDELFQNSEMLQNSMVWRDMEGNLAAYAYVHFPYNNLTFEIADLYWIDNLEHEILCWAEERMRLHYPADLAEQTLDGSCRVEDDRMKRFFVSHGFMKQEVESITYRVDLMNPLPAPVLPPGYSLRPLNPLSEIEKVVALHQAAYGTGLFSIEERIAIMNTAAYLPEMDLVVQAPDGSLAGNCICGIEQVTSENEQARGYTDPVVVHPQYQRRGIARALLLEGLTRLRERGIRIAELGTTNLNTGMRRAAEAAGFQCVSQRVWYSKKIE